MPPAPRNVFTAESVADMASKLSRPFHIINVKDYKSAGIKNSHKYRITVTFDRLTPEEISIKRSGNILTVESKNQSDVERTTHNYEIPEEGYNDEFAKQISADGIIALRELDGDNIIQNGIPIHVQRLPRMKPGTVIRLNAPEHWSANAPIDFSAPTNYTVDVQHPDDNSVEQEDNSNERNEEEENTENSANPEENAETDNMDIPSDDQRVPSDGSP